MAVSTIAWATSWPGWLHALQTLVFVGGAYALTAILHVRRERRMDEVQLAARRFGMQWGMFAGVAVMSIVSLSAPFQAFTARLATWSSESLMDIPTRMFLFGVVATFVAQEIARVAMTAGWKWSKR